MTYQKMIPILVIMGVIVPAICFVVDPRNHLFTRLSPSGEVNTGSNPAVGLSRPACFLRPAPFAFSPKTLSEIVVIQEVFTQS